MPPQREAVSRFVQAVVITEMQIDTVGSPVQPEREDTMLDKLIGPIVATGTMLAILAGMIIPESSSASTGEAAWHPSRASASWTADVPSHQGRYLATLTFDPAVRHGTFNGWVLVTTRDGVPVNGLRLELETTRPEDASVAATTPIMTAAIGEGRYRVRGITLDRAGWWSVRVVMHARTSSDSLAFNLLR